MKTNKKKLNQKNQNQKQSACYGLDVQDYYTDPGPDAVPIAIGHDYATIEGIIFGGGILTSGAGIVCYVEVLNNQNRIFVTEDVDYEIKDSETFVFQFDWTGLEYQTWYRGNSLHLHYKNSESGHHFVHEKPLRDFYLEDQSVKTYLKFDGFTNIEKTSITCWAESQSGKHLDGTQYTWINKILLSSVGHPRNPKATSSEVPAAGYDRQPIVLNNLQPGTTYYRYKLSDWVAYKYADVPVYGYVPPFTTLYNIEKPFFDIFEKVTDNSVSISYVLDLGVNENGRPFKTNGPVILYDQDDNEISSNSNSEGDFLVENLPNGTYSGWYLSVQTSYSSDPIIGKIDTFTINIGDIIEPQFSDYAVVTSDTSVEVSYQFNLGKDPNGDPYDLIGLIVLYNDKKQPIDSSDKIGDTLKANNLTPNTTYSDWSLETYTTYSTEAVNQPIGDFTTTSRKTTIKNN